MHTDLPARPIPRLPGRTLPWVGHALTFGRDPMTFLRTGRTTAGNTFGFMMLGQQVVFTSGVKAHETVLRAADSVLGVKEAHPFLKPIFGPGIAYDAEPAEMKRQFGYVLPALTPKRLSSYVPVMEDVVESIIAEWPDDGETDLPALMAELVGSITTRCLFGEDFQRRVGPDVPRLFADLANGIRLAGLLSAKLPLPAFRRRDRARVAMTDAITAAIATRRAGSTEDDDMLAALLSARTPEGEPVSDDTVIGILIAATFAGVHTGSALATWAGVVMLDHPEHLSALLNEQASAVPENERLSFERLRRMEMLERCIREAERLHPPAYILMRKARENFEVDGYHVPKGALVMISPDIAHRLPDVFTDPDTFDPDRYSPCRAEHRRPYSLIAFSGGTHRCSGLGFAYQELKVIWSVLLRRFDLELLGGPHHADYTTTFVAHPSSPCRIRYHRR